MKSFIKGAIFGSVLTFVIFKLGTYQLESETQFDTNSLVGRHSTFYSNKKYVLDKGNSVEKSGSKAASDTVQANFSDRSSSNSKIQLRKRPSISKAATDVHLQVGDRNQVPWNVDKQDTNNPAPVFNEDSIFNTKISQNDPELLQVTRNKYLIAPSSEPYNLNSPHGDPAAIEQQTATVLKLLKQLKNGVFVESGANDGEFLSSTLVLERDHGWTGLLVEPDPYAYSELLKKNRKAWKSPVCLSPEPFPKKVTYLHADMHSSRSGIESLVQIPGGTTQKLKNATCLPIFTLLSALNITNVDYFCLDVEGAELKVLKTIPFQSVFIKVFSIEFEHIPEGGLALKNFMQSKGYVFVKRLMGGNARDYVFIHESLKDNIKYL